MLAEGCSKTGHPSIGVTDRKQIVAEPPPDRTKVLGRLYGAIRTELCARSPKPIQCNAVGSWSVTAPARTQCDLCPHMDFFVAWSWDKPRCAIPAYNPGAQSRACDVSGACFACFLLHARLGSREHEGGGTLRSIISWQRSGIVVLIQSMGGCQWLPRPVGIHHRR